MFRVDTKVLAKCSRYLKHVCRVMASCLEWIHVDMFSSNFLDFRNFKLYLTTNTDLFTEDFRAVFVDKHGNEESFDVPLQNFFTGHVVGEWMVQFFFFF